ncbi:hypothetical protein CHU98_g1023 [Xylaria longipes]|nr:hypothetical protein CHU98_g1023 [Xylaria longipes]
MTVSAEERNRAARLVKEQPSSNISKAATAVLSSIADGTVLHSTAMLVKALLDLGAEVCFQRRKSTNVLKIVLNKDQVDVRSNLLEKATRNCSHDILFLLAQKADEQAVNQEIPIAIDQNDPEKVRILLARGASASPWCSQFLNAVESGSDEVVDELTRTINGACRDCRDKGLIRAATFGHASKVQILMDKGANPNFERANALRVTIGSGREDIGALIVSHKSMRVHTELLDMSIEDAYSKSKYQILIACLQTREGGPTETVNRVLLQAVERNQLDLVSPLLRSNASLEYQGGAVVVAAVLSRHHKLLGAVLSSGKASQSSMTAAIAQATESGDMQITGYMVDALISAGLRGDAVNKTLIRILDPKFAADDDDSRLGLVRLLLDKGGADVDFQQGTALVLAVTGGWVNILGLLIRYQPSFASLRAAVPPIMRLEDHEGLKAAAVSSAAEALRLDVLQYLAQPGLSESTILAGFSAAVSSESGWTTPSGLLVIQFLLDKGASGPPVDEAFCRATKLLARDAIGLLRDFISGGCVNQALLGMIESSPEWHYPDDRNLWLIESLLEWEACGEPVNIALLYALEAYTSTPKLASKCLVDILMVADVNFRHGEALKIAIRSGDASLLQELASLGANKETITHAFREAIIAQLEEKKVLELLKVLGDREPGYQPDFKRVLPNRCPPIFDCLAVYPESVELVKRLIKLGCEVDAKALTKLYDTTEPEYTTTLAWALSQSERGRVVSSAVITTLINAKAAKNSRGDIVKKLLEAKADSRSHDRFDKAALFYASQVGDSDAVKALLKTDFRMNDGSLHEAARNLRRDCVAALIKAKYDPNFRSSREEYDGRNALQEMAYRCDGSQKVPDMEATIWSLEKGGADALEKWRGKTALFLALSNPRPYYITRAFLNAGKRTTYTGNAAINAQLESLLRTMGCEDRYFAALGSEQLDDAVGLPEDIAKVKRRKDELDKYLKSEFDHKTKMQKHSDRAVFQSQQQLKLNFQQQTGQQKVELQGQQNMLTHQAQQHKIAQQQTQNKLAQHAQDQRVAMQEKQNRLLKEAQRQKVLNAQKMQAIKANEERERLKAKKAMHREDLSFRRSK